MDWWAVDSLDEAAAETVQDASGIAMALMEVAMALILIAILRRVHASQMAHYRRQRSGAATAPDADQPRSARRSSTAVP